MRTSIFKQSDILQPKHNRFLSLTILKFVLLLMLSSTLCILIGVTSGQMLRRSQELAVALRTSSKSAGRDIFLFDHSGSFPTLKIDPPGFDPQEVYWSPGGRQFGFMSSQPDERGLFVTNLYDFAPRLVTTEPVPRILDWSADGKTIAYADRTSNGVKLIHIGDNRVENIVGAQTDDCRPTWSPDDQHLAFVSKRNGRWGLYVADADGSHQRLITDYRVTSISLSISWSPDGRQITFISDKQGGAGNTTDIFTVNIADGNVRQITASKTIEYRPTWSPDGSLIAYWTQDYATETAQAGSLSLKLVSLNDGSITEFRTDQFEIPETNGVLLWSPNSRYLVFAMSLGDASSRVYCLDIADGTLQLLLAGYGDVPSPAWLS